MSLKWSVVWIAGECQEVGRGRERTGERGLEMEADMTSVFEAELQDVVPICRCTIAGTRIIGRLTAGYNFSSFCCLVHNSR